MVSRTAIQLSLVVALCVIGLVSCNNWQAYQSRSTSQSSTEWPFVPKIGNTPHYQVGLGQNFTMGWSVGHGNNAALYGLSSYTYVVILKFDDQHNIPGTQNGMMSLINQYINQAPMYSSTEGFTDLTNVPGWHRVQLLPSQYMSNGMTQNPAFWVPQVGVAVTGNGGYNNTMPSLYDYYENNGKEYKYGDPKYVNIDPTLMATNCRGGNSFCGTVGGTSKFVYPGQWVHNAAYDAHNVRLEYDNPNIPWIVSVSKFQISVSPADYTNTYNAAWFRVPARKGPGNFMAWYIWAGYSDVTDVNVMPSSTPVASPYKGTSGSTAVSYTRVDHCELNFIQNTQTGCHKVDPNTMDISQCVKDCTANGNGGCNAIQVSRASNVPTTYTLPDGTTRSYTTPVNIPFVAYNMSQLSMTGNSVAIGPCGFLTVPLRVRAGCNSTTNNMINVNPMTQRCIASDFLPTDYVCFGVNYNNAQNGTLQATPPFSFANEPQDPRFYSSCILKAQTYGFDPATFPAYPTAKPKWQAASSCVPCSFLDKVNSMNTFNSTYAKVPNWEKVTLSPNGCAPCY